MSALVQGRNLALAGRIEVPALDIAPGTLVALVGPNGGGKTSLLRALAGVEGAHGTVTIDGQDRDALPPARRGRMLGFAPASRDIAWPIRVRAMLGLSPAGGDDAHIDALLDAFELTSLADRPADTLSTGERARVIIARTLAARPRLLLLDEPLANLDPYWALHLLDLIRDAVRNAGSAALVALHDLAQLERFDRVLLVDEGRIQIDETPAHLMANERFLAHFRLASAPGGRIAIRPSADRQSSP